MTTRADELQGKRVKIVDCENRFARAHIGKRGTVVGYAPSGDMVIIAIDNEPLENGHYHAYPRNLAKCK